MNPLDQHLAIAKEFCQNEEFPTNENGVYIFNSADGSTSINLPAILMDFKQFLIDEDVMRENN